MSDSNNELNQARALPREKWRSHPHYPSQVLLLGSHQNFRAISKILVEAAESEVAGGRLESLERLFESWQAGMKNHERYEEAKLYPFLRRRYCVSTESLERGHEQLGELKEQVRVAFASANRDELHEALAIYDRALHAHLTEEEDLVIPLLLALEPEEFASYAHGSVRQVLDQAELQHRCGC